jgi:arylsulfatase A-like enzyme
MNNHCTLSRRKFLKSLGISAAALSLPAVSFNCMNRERRLPNILFIMADDHAYQAISAYEGRINKTPNLDRLAAQGMRFVNSFCTNSICAPSRAVILTGKHSHLNGVLDNRMRFDGSQTTLPKLLKEEGYETALFGKWHLKSDPTGFDYWNILPGQGHYYNPDMIEMGERTRRTGYVTDIITDDCLKWLEKRETERPFFAMLHHKAPHRNWMPGPDHLKMYDGEEIPVPETYFDDYATRSDAAREQEMEVGRHATLAYDLKITPPSSVRAESEDEKPDMRWWKGLYGRMSDEQRKAWDEAYEPRNRAFHGKKLKGRDLALYKYQRYIKDYLRCIASIDDNIGRVLDFLDENKLTKDTIVVYTSDQGFYLGEHGWFDKRFMYEESLRMPLIIRYPREIKAGVNREDLVQNLDFAPTLLDFGGAAIPEDMQGRSFRSILQGHTPEDWRDAIYYHYHEFPAVHQVKRHYGIRTKQYKLIHFYNDIDAWELYDLEADPHEVNNLYGNPDYTGLVQDLKDKLYGLQMACKDTGFKQNVK